MKKLLNLFFACIFLFLLLFVPSKINAQSYISDFVNLKDSVVFETDEFELDLEYTVLTNESEIPAVIDGNARRKTNNMYYYHYVIYYYDNHKQEIGATDGYNGIWDNMSSSNGSYFSSFIDEKNMVSPYKVSDVKYYKLFIEPATKEIADEYLYQNNKKINMIGLDPIIDNNPVGMKYEKKEPVRPNINNGNINTHGNGEYALTKYKIDIKVNENNTFFITENITAKFNISKHGIFRKLPLRNEVIRLDGTKSYNRAKISDINVDTSFTTYNERGYKIIKIGSPNYTIKGSKNYEISYLYNIGKDPGKGYDEFYFNLIGNEWDTTISEIEFNISMPKEFDESKLGFSSGKEGSVDNSNIIYNVDDNVITGLYNGVLKPGEGLTVRLELPEGYFVGASNNLDLITMLSIILPIIFVVISFLLWIRYGKDEQAIDTVEFYPPEGFNSAEIGFLYKGYANNNDVVSLLIYLANKGYLKIEETEDKSFFTFQHRFKIIKLKEYDGNNINEKTFLDGLFDLKKNNSQTELQEVSEPDLYNKFYITLNVIIRNINNKKNKYKIFEKTSLSKKSILKLFIIATYLLITVKPVIENGGSELLLFALIFPTVGFFVFWTTIFGKKDEKTSVNENKIRSLFERISLGLIFGTMFGGIPWLYIVMPSLQLDPMYSIAYIIGLVCIIIMIILHRVMPKRTKYGNEILGKIKGFRNFLETAEKPKLEALVMQDPKYFYNILPYTYVLGVSDKWIQKFEAIALQAPDWYSGNEGFNMVTFGSFMNSTMTSASTAMSSSPSSSGSGGSSGGGSSGGGSGGGGGGSW